MYKLASDLGHRSSESTIDDCAREDGGSTGLDRWVFFCDSEMKTFDRVTDM